MKILKYFVPIIISIVIFACPVKAAEEIDYDRLGKQTGVEVGGTYYFDGFAQITEVYFQFGSIIKIYYNGNFITLVAYDICGNGNWTKEALDCVTKDQKIYVSICKLNDLLDNKNNTRILYNGEQNYLDILDENELYLCIFTNESGEIISVRKISKTSRK